MREPGVSQAICTVQDMIRMLHTFPEGALLSFDGTLNYPSVLLSMQEDGPLKVVTIVSSMWCRK